MKERIADRFWAKVDKGSDCWEWQGRKTPLGYGQFSVKGKPQLAHRVCWELTFGAIPDGLCVYAWKLSPQRLKLCYHTEFNKHFMKIMEMHD